MKDMGRWETQDSNPDAWVGVSSSGTHEATNTPVASEFVIQQKGPDGEHVHLGFDQYGNQIFENRR
jgi:hypothetical protein